MKSTALICLGLLALTVSPGIQALEKADLAGWWSADPVHGGETTHLALQFVEKDGKQEAHLSLTAIGAYDINLGEVTIAGDAINTARLAFPLAWNTSAQTLSGVVPAEAAPLYRIPVEFRRGAPLEKPPANEWKAPRPAVRWSLDTGGSAGVGGHRARPRRHVVRGQ